MKHAGRSFGLSFAVVGGVLASLVGGCGSSEKAPAQAELPSGSFYTQRPNPGSEGFVPWGNRLTTATRRVPEQLVAIESFQAVGIAITPGGRLFLSAPRWHGQHETSVLEFFPGSAAPPEAYPTEAWNSWEPGVPGDIAFVCVQAMHVDDAGRFWVLDAGAPGFEGPVEGGAKLMQFDTASNTLEASFLFDPSVAPQGSYLNDVRIDVERGFAYLTDSNLGAIIGLDLTTGVAARFLETHPSTKAEPVRLVIGGEPWVDESGFSPLVHSDGLALSPDNEYLYYQALTARTLYRVPTGPIREVLRPTRAAADMPAPRWAGATIESVDDRVESLGTTFATDAMIMDDNGVLYFTSLENDAITARLPSGELTMVTSDERLVWPDSFCIHNGLLYVTTARIHEVGFGNEDGPVADGPFRVLRVPLLDPEID
ncbi:MAG: L-dopachrome tautomerase-related protein [Planctomycetota bacterium]